MTDAFITTTHGKWILSGEHAVLRGCPALIFPVASRSLTLSYHQEPCQPQAKPDPILEKVFRQALDRALVLVNQPQAKLDGYFNLHNTIPISMGMGASAALCVALGQWLVWRDWLAQDKLYEFARELENLFHQESSGADIAACMADSGIWFKRDGGCRNLAIQWQPIWFLSHSGKSSETAACVQKVKALYQRDPILGQELDQAMQQSVLLAEKALGQPQGLTLLKQAIDIGHQCFVRWGLTSGKVDQHITLLRSAGALAVKPTGSGDGGFVLSLWKQAPKELPFELIAL